MCTYIKDKLVLYYEGLIWFFALFEANVEKVGGGKHPNSFVAFQNWGDIWNCNNSIWKRSNEA